jgi:hypothetical protein
MKATIYAAMLALALLASPAFVAADKKPDDKQAEKKEDKEEAKEEAKKAKGTESPWTEEQVKNFVKTGLKLTYSHKEPTVAMGKPVMNNPVFEVLEAADRSVRFKWQDFMINTAVDRIIQEPIDMEHTVEWSAAVGGIFNRPLLLTEKLETSKEKLKIDGKNYSCIVYTWTGKHETDKQKWWVSSDLPGVILKYQDLGMAKINGAIIKDYVSESYELTKIEQPKADKKARKKK